MKSIDRIPTSKIERASKLVTTGVKLVANYAKYYGEKVVSSQESAKENLDQANANDIYDSLKSLKGSALKMAQMLSMEKHILPKAYTDKFSLSQFSVPPLSAPLVVKTFRKYFKKNPSEVFDEFTLESVNAASIGQVHQAKKDGQILAVKIQYPGVAESISSDLAIVKPIAIKMFNLKGKGSEAYFKEVEEKLIEETDYVLELKQSQEVADACKELKNIKFPRYYPAYSTSKILTMDWMNGCHLSEFVKQNNKPSVSNKIGQALWDFYMFQLHHLKKVHADPHPGNFLISEDNELIVIDFGCMKSIPESFYTPYFELLNPKNFQNESFFEEKLYELEILKEDDTPEQVLLFKSIFHELLSLFIKPFRSDFFDFSDRDFFDQIAELSQKYSNDSKLRKQSGNRGSKHFIYINRTFFGLYNLMHELGASSIKINQYVRA